MLIQLHLELYPGVLVLVSKIFFGIFSRVSKSVFLNISASSPYVTLGRTKVDQMNPFKHALSPFPLWKPAPIKEYAVLRPSEIFSSIQGLSDRVLSMPR